MSEPLLVEKSEVPKAAHGCSGHPWVRECNDNEEMWNPASFDVNSVGCERLPKKKPCFGAQFSPVCDL